MNIGSEIFGRKGKLGMGGGIGMGRLWVVLPVFLWFSILGLFVSPGLLFSSLRFFFVPEMLAAVFCTRLLIAFYKPHFTMPDLCARAMSFVCAVSFYV